MRTSSEIHFRQLAYRKRRGHEAQHEYHDCEHGERPAPAAQLILRIQDGGMADTDDADNSRPHKPTEPEVSEGQQREPKNAGEQAVVTAQRGVEDMTAIELAHRQQIERGGKKP